MNSTVTPLIDQFAMLDHMPVGAFVLRRDFVVIFWNRVLEDWTGFSREEVVGLPLSIHFPHLNAPKYAIRIQDVFNNGTPFIFSSYIHESIIPVMLQDEQIQIQSAMVTRVPDPLTNDFYVLFSIQDVTELTHRIADYRTMRDQAQKEIAERKQAEIRLKEGEERLRRVVENMPVLMVAFDADRNIIVWNRECERITGYTADEILKNPQALKLLFPHAPYRERTLARLFRQNREFYGLELEMASKHGPTKVVSWSNTSGAFPIPGWALWAVGVDVTERKRAEKAIQEARKVAEDANQAKSAFLANMSHELRTPLNAILGFSQLIARTKDVEQDEHDYLQIIRRNGQHLLTLINQVLDLSKIEAGKMTLDETDVDLVGLLEDVIDLFRLRAQEKGLCLIFDHSPEIPHHVRTDEVKLRQVLINLLSNAIKFTKKGEVSLEVRKSKAVLHPQPINSSTHQLKNSSTQKLINSKTHQLINSTTHTMLQFLISDTGSGIAPEEVPQLFEPFAQTTTGREAREGTGLGLPISQKFVRLMGGDIYVESTLGQGSTFTFEIPFKHNPHQKRVAQQTARHVIGLAPDQPQYRILIADDDEDSRQLLSELLGPLGFDLYEVLNGQQAVEIWKTWAPHLIWMDIRMPVLDGYAATKRIRQLVAQHQHTGLSASPNPVIVAVTAGPFEEEQAAAQEAGCDDFLRKPYTDTEIFELLHKHLGVEYTFDVPDTRKFHIPEGTADDVHTLTSQALETIPTELINAFEEATVTNDMHMITLLIGQLRGYNTRLADILEEWANHFDYLNILTWVQDIQAHADSEPSSIHEGTPEQEMEEGKP